MDVTEPSLWRHGDFMKLWTGQTVSELGSVVTRTAIPIAAVITLHASALQVGILVASASTAVLLVGLFAGALVDRSRRRPLMIVADAIRALVVLSIPVMAIAGALRIEQLFVSDLRLEGITPHVTQNTTNRRSAIDGRTTRHPGYAKSQHARPRIERVFGWTKTTGLLRKTRHRGKPRVGWIFTFTLAVYDLVRLRALCVADAQ